jgi:N-acetylneuraminate synthase
MTKRKCKIVAEGCCNHMGDFDIAIEMTKIAKICGADYIKWQKRTPELAVPSEWHNMPHPNQSNAFGNTYLEHRKNLEFTIDQHFKLKEEAEKIGIGYSCSVWDELSANEIIELNPDFIKIPSAMNANVPLIEHIIDKYKNQIHISTGMMTIEEKNNLASLIKKYQNRFVVYHTTTEYPCKFEHLYLKEIENLRNNFDIIGYSGHNYGIAADIAALTLGVSWIERHFTLDRTWKGTDQAASLEPDGLRRLCRDVDAIEKALQYKTEDMTMEENKQRGKLKIIKNHSLQ